MSVKFLTPEWTQGLADTVNAHEGFKSAIANVELGLQFVVKDAPHHDNPYHYYVNIQGGNAEIAEGDLDGPDATITNGYETAEGISKGTVNTQMAFMSGKLQVQGDLAKLMMNQGALNAFATAAAGLDVDYPES